MTALEAHYTTATEHATAVTCCGERGRSHALDLSRARTHDAALNILKAYKLSGNFCSNLEVVLKDMGVSDVVTYRTEPHPAFAFPDCRHVVFTLSGELPDGRCDDIVRTIEARIGFATPWWGRMLRRCRPEAAGAAPCRTHY
jgi:hypothetical protein